MYRRLGESDYAFEPTTGECKASKEMVEDFANNGFVITRHTFDEEEIAKITNCLTNSDDFWKADFEVADKSGRNFESVNWTWVGSDPVGMALRTEKVGRVAETLLGRGPLYQYSGKVIMKRPRTGGELIWHQDYGYWYNTGCLFPDMMACFVALTKNDRENGGIQLLKGSHHCGRIEHKRTAGQTGADPERVAKLEERLELVYCDLGPGDVVFFHANVLHQSPPNDSEHKRWNLIFSLTTVTNTPPDPSRNYNGNYSEDTKIVLAPQDAVVACPVAGMQKRDYIDPARNHNIAATADAEVTFGQAA